MTLLAVSISGDTEDDIRQSIVDAVDQGAELLEFRVDLMPGVSDDSIRILRQRVPENCPCILTIRHNSEGGNYDGGDDERVSRLIELGPLFDYIDVELALWRRSANIRQKIGLALRRAGHISQHAGKEEIEQAAPRGLILSKHDLAGRPTTLHSDLLEMLREPMLAHPKLAWRARSVRDNFEAFDLMRTTTRPGIFICMGEQGLLSRVLAKKFWAFASFASLRPGFESAPGQATLKAMKEVYRCDAIGGRTALYGVAGDPVGHSLGPQVHNAAFSKHGIDAVYLPLPVAVSYESFKAFMVEAQAHSFVDVRGLSVTIPHKENALRFARESGGRVDPLCDRVGACNTLRVTEGAVEAFNTDYSGARDTIRKAMSDDQAPRGATCLVIGAGGAARAIVAALMDGGGRVTICNRTDARASALAEQFGCERIAWSDRASKVMDLIVNCTPVGMWPGPDVAPIDVQSMPGSPIVFDTVYKPTRTRLLRDAEARGWRTIDGLSFFAEQAAGQFEIWTGRRETALFFEEIARRSAPPA